MTDSIKKQQQDASAGGWWGWTAGDLFNGVLSLVLPNTKRTSSSSAGLGDDGNNHNNNKDKNSSSSNNNNGGDPSSLSVDVRTMDPRQRSLFGTIDQFWTVWRAIGWISSHRQYMTLGMVLAEYATKSALSCLPEKDCERCEQLLGVMGMDVKNVSLVSVGESALNVAMTGAPVMMMMTAAAQQPAASSCSTTHNNNDELRWLLRQARLDMRTVASLPPPTVSFWASLHAAYAIALTRTETPEEMLLEARRVYGPRAWRWVRGGLCTLRATRIPVVKERDDISLGGRHHSYYYYHPDSVANAFDCWYRFCSEHAHMLMHEEDDDRLVYASRVPMALGHNNAASVAARR